MGGHNITCIPRGVSRKRMGACICFIERIELGQRNENRYLNVWMKDGTEIEAKRDNEVLHRRF